MSIERRKRKKGVVWRVQWREAGRNRNRTFERKKDAEAFEAMLRLAKRQGRLGQLDAGEEPLRDFWAEWWRLDAEPRLAAKTLELYGMWRDRYVFPRLGDVALRELNPAMIQRFQTELIREGVGEPTVRKAVVLLQGVLERAVEWGRIPTNPARVVRKPAVGLQRTVRPPSPEIVEAMRDYLIARARQRDATLVSVLAYAGLRPGEALALSWGDVGKSTILVDKRLTTDGLKLGAKSKSRSRRSVHLLRPLAADLSKWRLACGRPSDDSPVFPRRDGDLWRDHDFRNWRKRVFAPAAEAVGLEGTRPYDLRHAFCSLLLAEGRTPIYVASQMGHSPRMTLETYGHLIEELEDQPRIDAEGLILSARELRVAQM